MRGEQFYVSHLIGSIGGYRVMDRATNEEVSRHANIKAAELAADHLNVQDALTHAMGGVGKTPVDVGAVHDQQGPAPDREMVGLMLDMVESYIKQGMTSFDAVVRRFTQDYGPGSRDFDQDLENAWLLLKGQAASVQAVFASKPSEPAVKPDVPFAVTEAGVPDSSLSALGVGPKLTRWRKQVLKRPIVLWVISWVITGGAVLAMAWTAWSGPRTYDDCILEHVHPGTSDQALLFVAQSCRNKFPAPDQASPSDGPAEPLLDLVQVAGWSILTACVAFGWYRFRRMRRKRDRPYRWLTQVYESVKGTGRLLSRALGGNSSRPTPEPRMRRSHYQRLADRYYVARADGEEGWHLVVDGKTGREVDRTRDKEAADRHADELSMQAQEPHVDRHGSDAAAAAVESSSQPELAAEPRKLDRKGAAIALALTSLGIVVLQVLAGTVVTTSIQVRVGTFVLGGWSVDLWLRNRTLSKSSRVLWYAAMFGILLACWVGAAVLETLVANAHRPPFERAIASKVKDGDIRAAVRRALGREPTTDEEGRSAMAGALAEGMRRLDDRDLVDLAAVRFVLASKLDEANCAAMLKGGASPVDVNAALPLLPAETQGKFIDLVATAIVAEANGTPAQQPPPGQEEGQQAFLALSLMLPAQDKQIVGRALLHLPASTAETQTERCAATRSFYSALANIAPQSAALLVRLSLY
jgi:hypothetical protein